MSKIINKIKKIIRKDFNCIVWTPIVTTIIILIPLFINIIFGKDIKPCRNFCCIHIKYIVTEDIIDNRLIKTKHGLDCDILQEYKANAVSYATETYYKRELINCWFCNGELINYNINCHNFCCKHIKYILDLTTAVLHEPNCEKLIKICDPYMAMFKSEKYNIIKMGYKGDYLNLCYCLRQYARIR